MMSEFALGFSVAALAKGVMVTLVVTLAASLVAVILGLIVGLIRISP
ncbi:MAG: ectoine/hydroxyectoine ABC transporter permease subunit EhuC, partial [Mesorhizobium sp.]